MRCPKESPFGCPQTLNQLLLYLHIMSTQYAPVNGHSAPDPSVGPLVTELRDEEHITFVKDFQARFDAFYCSLSSVPYGSQKTWVTKNVMGEFQQRFGPASRTVLEVCTLQVLFSYLALTSPEKIDRYLRNHSSRNSKTSSSPAPSPPNLRAVSWLHIMAQENKPAIDARAAALRKAEGVTGPADFLHYFRRARQEMADSLPESKIQEYKASAAAESKARKAPPTPAVIFEYVFSLSYLSWH